MLDSEEGQARKEKRPHTVGSRRTVESRDRFKVGAHRERTIAERSWIRESWCDERERIAYKGIARSFKPGKRS